MPGNKSKISQVVSHESRDTSHYFNKGFTLLEVLIALTILAFGLLALNEGISRSG